VEVDDIISYHHVVTAEKASLQKGMNYGVHLVFGFHYELSKTGAALLKNLLAQSRFLHKINRAVPNLRTRKLSVPLRLASEGGPVGSREASAILR
jgi:hypothetical protein